MRDAMFLFLLFSGLYMFSGMDLRRQIASFNYFSALN